MAYRESNGQVTDDVTLTSRWPWKGKAMTPICLWPDISETHGDAIQQQSLITR